MQIRKKAVMPMYILIQMLYFMIMALMFNYATVYLLDRGYSVSRIGLLLGVNSVLTMLCQPLVAEVIRKTRINLCRGMAGAFLVIALLAAALLLLPLKGIVFAVVLVVVFVLENVMQPSINSIYRGYHNQGIEINFAKARGMGSAIFSLTTLVAGMYLSRVTPHILPAFYLVPSVLLAVCLWIFHAPNVEDEDSGTGAKGGFLPLLRDYPHFTLFIIGVALIATAHSFTESFMLLIIGRVGGDSSNLGVALAISSVTELPAMLLYKKISKKYGNRRLMMFAGWMWVTKNLIIALAPSVELIYAAQLLQFVSYAVYVPTAAKHIAHAIPQSQFLQGQALAGSAFTAGGLIATLLGGQLIEHLGITPALLIIQCFSFVGVIIFTFSIHRSLQIIPSKPKGK